MAIPVISTLPELQLWRASLKNTLRKVAAPTIPWNFQGVTKQGGNYLTWTPVKGADGYEIDIATSADFSALIQLKTFNSQTDAAYFDSVPTQTGAAPAARYYRIRATSGTIAQPHSIKGRSSGAVGPLVAIAPNDTTTASSSSGDNSTSDKSNTGGGRGRYFTY